MSILPSGKPKFDKKLDDLFGLSLAGLDIGVINILADSCPASLLGILADSLDVNIDELNETGARLLIKEAFKIHYYSGTFYAVKKAVNAIDSGAIIVEGNLGQKYDGSIKYDRSRFYGSNSHWAEYSIISSIPLSKSKAAAIAEAAKAAAPARCVLALIEHSTNQIKHDGQIRYNDQFNYGAYDG